MKQNRRFKITFAMILCMAMLFGASITTMAAEISKPSTPKISTVTRKGKGKTTIKWSKISGASGYEIQYGKKKDYSDAKKVKISKGSTTSQSISGMSSSKDTWIRMRAYKKVKVEEIITEDDGSKETQFVTKKIYSKWSANVKMIVWKTSWTYAKNSKIHTDPAFLYYASTSKANGVTVAVNAGHGCKGGSSKKTLCHPDGSLKVTDGSTGAGAKYATAINEGTTVRGVSEASLNLKVAKKFKSKLLSAGYNVLMIRQDSNTQLDNIARTVMANKNADCHIAIHYDSTTNDKGAFFMSVPNVKSYRNMKPVKSHWKQHNKLGSKVISGLKSAGVKIWNSGSLEMDLTQTSYSTVPSIDIEVGDEGSSIADKQLEKIAKGLAKGIGKYFGK